MPLCLSSAPNHRHHLCLAPVSSSTPPRFPPCALRLRSVRVLCPAPLCPRWPTRDNQVGDGGASGLGKWLKHNMSLTRLDLWYALERGAAAAQSGDRADCEILSVLCVLRKGGRGCWCCSERASCRVLLAVMEWRSLGKGSVSMPVPVCQPATVSSSAAAAAAGLMGECRVVRTLTLPMPLCSSTAITPGSPPSPPPPSASCPLPRACAVPCAAVPPWPTSVNQVGDGGASALGEGLEHNTSLTSLDLECALGRGLQLFEARVGRGCGGLPVRRGLRTGQGCWSCSVRAKCCARW
jgi:hypothetical protein